MVEERSELDVFYDLSGAGADVIQMRSPDCTLPEGLFRCVRTQNLLNDAYRTCWLQPREPRRNRKRPIEAAD